jgi:MYXO-CTERM domain-containing protein
VLNINASSSPNSRFTIALASLDRSDRGALLAGFDASHNYEFEIAAASGGIVGFDPSVFQVDTSGFLNPLHGGHFTVQVQGNGIYLDFTSAAPEPSSIISMGVGLLGVVGLAAHRTRRAHRTGTASASV